MSCHTVKAGSLDGAVSEALAHRVARLGQTTMRPHAPPCSLPHRVGHGVEEEVDRVFTPDTRMALNVRGERTAAAPVEAERLVPVEDLAAGAPRGPRV